jgi:ParB family chromosome partitioning protein
VAELAIVENLQRKDLNPIEKALSFRRYIEQHQCTQEDLASRLKIDRSTLANLMRLLELPVQVQEALGNGSISAGHARALLPLGDEAEQIAFAERIQRDGMSVRATEREVAEMVARLDGNQRPISEARGRRRTRNHQVENLEKQLRLALGAKVRIQKSNGGRGSIVIEFQDHDDFERLNSFLLGTEFVRARAA